MAYVPAECNIPFSEGKSDFRRPRLSSGKKHNLPFAVDFDLEPKVARQVSACAHALS